MKGVAYEKVEKIIDGLSEEYLSFLEEICSIESNTYDKEGIGAVVDYVVERQKKNGYIFERKSFEKAGDVLCATMNIGEKKPCVALSGHMDTVYQKGVFGYPPVKKDERYIYGPGVSDCKGGIVVGFLAMEALKRCGFDGCNVKIILQSDEEVSSSLSEKKTVDFICEKAKGCSAFLNLETGRKGKLTVERNGIVKAKIDVIGQAVHAKDKQNGVNAIHAAALKSAKLSSSDEDGIAFNVGRIDGGGPTNIVPDRCSVALEIRIRTMQGYHRAMEILKEVVEDNPLGERTELTVLSFRPPFERLERNLKLLEKVNETASRYGFERKEERMSSGGSDAVYPSTMGIPTLDGFGIVGEKYHTVEEYAEISSLAESAKFLAAVILDLFQ